MQMTQAQYDAMMQISEHGERMGHEFLNVRPSTMAVMIKRGWVLVSNNHASVTAAGWAAVGAIV